MITNCQMRAQQTWYVELWTPAPYQSCPLGTIIPSVQWAIQLGGHPACSDEKVKFWVLLPSQWNWPDSAQDRERLHFSTRRKLPQVFLQIEMELIRNCWGPPRPHCNAPPFPPLQCSPPCSRAANHPFLSYWAFRSGRRRHKKWDQ